MRYMVHLDSFHIDTTRSVHEDTDYVTLTVQVNQQSPVNQTIYVGDVNDGDHPAVDKNDPSKRLSLGPFDVGPSDTLKVNYVVLNKGHANGDRDKIETALAAAATKAITMWIPGVGALSDFIAIGIGALIQIIDADCDGPCAAQQFTFSGAELEQRSSGTGSFGERTRDEIESQIGCGDSGVYYVTWHISRVPAPNVSPWLSVLLTEG